MKKHVVYIERQKPFWLRIIAALLYTIAASSIIYFFSTMDFSLGERHFYAHFDLIQIVAASLFFAIYFSYTINCHFNFEEKLFKRELTVGIFKYGSWKPLPQLNYVSIFRPNPDTFHVNLFYSNNKHWDLYEKFDYEDAYLIAFELSDALNIDLLDATVWNNFKWVDKIRTEKSGQLTYKD